MIYSWKIAELALNNNHSLNPQSLEYIYPSNLAGKREIIVPVCGKGKLSIPWQKSQVRQKQHILFQL